MSEQRTNGYLHELSRRLEDNLIFSLQDSVQVDILLEATEALRALDASDQATAPHSE